MTERLVSGKHARDDDGLDTSLRPHYMDDFVGQQKVKENLHIAIQAAKMRDEPLDHVLLYGPPGLGKTTLGNIIAREMEVNIKVTSGPAIERAGDMAAVLTSLNKGDVLFIDEIHRLSRVVEEVLYPALGGLLPLLDGGQRAGRQEHEPAGEPVHADRGYHALRHAQPSTAGPVRLHLPAGILRRGVHGLHSAALGRRSWTWMWMQAELRRSPEGLGAPPGWPTGC